jgi:hypothetical protein
MTDTTVAAPVAGTTAPGVATPPPAAWYDGASPEIVGHLQSHGWDKGTPTAAALAAVQAHQNAAKLIGHPPDKLARIPEANDEAGWKGFYEKIGTPTDPKAYVFDNLKKADGTALDAATTDFYRAQAVALHLTPAAAQQMVQADLKQQAGVAAAALADKTATMETERAALMKNWGPNAEANLFVVRQTAAALGVTPEAISALEKMEGVGYAKVMEMFRTIGGKMGEDTFVRSTAPSGGVMSQDQAASRKQELMSDTAWVQRYSDGGKTELREMMALQAILLGQRAQ